MLLGHVEERGEVGVPPRLARVDDERERREEADDGAFSGSKIKR